MAHPPDIGPEWSILVGVFNVRCKEKIDELVYAHDNNMDDFDFVIRDGAGERTIDGGDVVNYDKSYLYAFDGIKVSQIPYHRVRKILTKSVCVWQKR